MPDNKYCYPDSDVLINKLNVKDKQTLFLVEKELTSIRLQELQRQPITGKFDFLHLRKIHKYIFQDIYQWAGEIRTVEIGKGNLFCTTSCIQSYGESVFNKYYAQCKQHKDNREDFIKVLAENYADLNALHPFREGNGRTQREFARLLCSSCGYVFDLSCTTHEKMLQASQLSFDKADSSLLCDIFKKAVTPIDDYIDKGSYLKILTSDDLKIGLDEFQHYDYYSSSEISNIEKYNSFYKERTQDNLQKVDSPQPKKKMSLKSAVGRKQEVVEQRQADRQSQDLHKFSKDER